MLVITDVEPARGRDVFLLHHYLPQIAPILPRLPLGGDIVGVKYVIKPSFGYQGLDKFCGQIGIADDDTAFASCFGSQRSANSSLPRLAHTRFCLEFACLRRGNDVCRPLSNVWHRGVNLIDAYVSTMLLCRARRVFRLLTYLKEVSALGILLRQLVSNEMQHRVRHPRRAHNQCIEHIEGNQVYVIEYAIEHLRCLCGIHIEVLGAVSMVESTRPHVDSVKGILARSSHLYDAALNGVGQRPIGLSRLGREVIIGEPSV
ncbi:MAG TPA: hypothetical protein VE338_18225 [Ktedonobacterales bacterium]|nr:hypothetical protein [Ktedonobacterales bacterium]